MTRALLVFPGHGAYTAGALGSLPADHPLVEHAETLRAEYRLPSLLGLDRADRFEPRTHLAPSNAAPLIFLASLVDAERLPEGERAVAALGSSLGWLTALTAAGALPFEDGFRLVQELSLLEEAPAEGSDDAEGSNDADEPGGQLIYPLTDVAWRPNAELADRVVAALAAEDPVDPGVFPSIDLGGYAVLAGTEAGLVRLAERLPAKRVGERRYPLRLAMERPRHSPLARHLADALRGRVADLDWRPPHLTLVDGRGARWTPWSTDPVALRDYTLGAWIVAPYDFAGSLRVALREEAPDILVLPGPGRSLGAVCGQILVGEGYRGLRQRADFEARQRAEPLLRTQPR